MRKFVSFVGLLLLVGLVSVSASAQDNSKIDLFGGYSYLMFRPNSTGVASKINFNGGVGSVAFNLNDWLAGVAEFGGYHAGTIKNAAGVTQTGVTANAVTYLFGPKIYKSMGKITPFGQVLFGGAHGSATSSSVTVSQNGFAMALGGGLDWNASPHFAVRLGQVEYLLSRFNNNVSNGVGSGGTGTQNNFRYSGGVVFKF
jgi:hypothetical protein